jgi:uncharacterized protein
MKILVRVRPGAKTAKIEKVSEAEFSVWVKAPAREGKANAAVIEILSDYFGRPRRFIRLLKGESSRNKWFEVV